MMAPAYGRAGYGPHPATLSVLNGWEAPASPGSLLEMHTPALLYQNLFGLYVR